MGKAKASNDLRPEYKREDPGAGIRGKYFEEYSKGTNLVLLSPDVADVFSTEEAVNEALGSLIPIEQVEKTISVLPTGSLMSIFPHHLRDGTIDKGRFVCFIWKAGFLVFSHQLSRQKGLMFYCVINQAMVLPGKVKVSILKEAVSSR